MAASLAGHTVPLSRVSGGIGPSSMAPPMCCYKPRKYFCTSWQEASQSLLKVSSMWYGNGDVIVLLAGIVMILAAAFEFNSDQSQLVKKRPSDDMELSEVLQYSSVHMQEMLHI